MHGQFVIVAERGLSDSAYGARISMTDPMSETEALLHIERIARGDEPDFFKPPVKFATLKVSDRQYAVVSTGRMTSTRHTRLTVAEVVATRG